MKKKLFLMVTLVMTAVAVTACGGKKKEEPVAYVDEYEDDDYVDEYYEEDDDYYEDEDEYYDEYESSYTCEDFYTDEYIEENVQPVLDMMIGSEIIDASFTVFDNTLYYTYVMSDEAAAQATFDEEALDNAMPALMDTIRAECGVQDPLRVVYDYADSHGQIIYEYMYEE